MEKSSFNSKHEREKTNKNNFYFKTEKKLLRISFKENQLRENNNFRRTKVRKKRPLIPFVHILYIHVCVIIFINYYYYHYYYHYYSSYVSVYNPPKRQEEMREKTKFWKMKFFCSCCARVATTTTPTSPPQPTTPTMSRHKRRGSILCFLYCLCAACRVDFSTSTTTVRGIILLSRKRETL